MIAQCTPASTASDSYGSRLDQLYTFPLDVQRFLSIAIQIVAAVTDLHQSNTIHKDIKPANILINSETGKVRIVDSGISTQAPRERHLAQNPINIQATLAYMSPEQTGRMNRMLDYRTDLYSLGVTFYEMLTGQLPFQADTPLEWVYCHIARTPRLPEEILPTLPRTLSGLVMRLLAKMAEDRYQSARSLMADLEMCQIQWEATGQILPFAPRQHDISDWFQIPQRLYGREREVADLLCAFAHMADTGSPEFVLVSGYSGIGKSSVVNELHKPVLEAHGAFLIGKFDQYRRNIPYATIMEAAQGLVQQILAGSEVEVADWKRRLETALEGDGSLLIGVVPQIALILGKQLPVQELPPLQAQRRFQRAFGRFLSVFADKEHPLALFLDDLQWADAASLELLEHLLTTAGTTHLMVIGAYRDNEVGAVHPLLRTIEAIGKKLNPLEIRLGPLEGASICELVTNTLSCTPKEAEPLVALVQEKTAGNPFFTEQFLQMLYRDAMIWFDHANQQWRWDMVRIRDANVTNNVVELMAGQIICLELEAREALKRAACIGNQFDLRTLAQVMEQPLAYVTQCLLPAVQKGLLLVSENGLEHSRKKKALHGLNEESHVLYSWLHDRVQQAAYSLISEEELPDLHLTIGHALQNRTLALQPAERLFEIANHLNAAVERIADPGERLALVELNLTAGRRARDSAAFAAALTYLSAGYALLSPESWEAQYDLTYAVTMEYARCKWTCGHLAAAEDLIAVLRNQARDRVHRAEVYGIEAELQNTQGNIVQSVQTILAACVELCAIDLPLHPTTEALREAAELTWQEVGSRSVEELVHLPAMTDPSMKAVMAFLSAALPAAYFTDINLHDLMCCHIVRLSLRHGNSDYTPHGYACFGASLGRMFEMWKEAYRFASVSLDLLEQGASSQSKGGPYFVTGAFIYFWVRPLREALPIFHKSLDASYECGNINIACIAANQLVVLQFAMGTSLAQVAAEAEKFGEFARQAKHQAIHLAISGIYSCVQSLRGQNTPEFPALDGPALGETEFETLLKAQVVSTWALTYWAYKSLIKLLAGDSAGAVEAALEGEAIRSSSVGFSQEAEHCFYAALALAAHYEHVTPDEQKEFLETLLAHQERYRLWQKHGPATFHNRHALISAEIARIRGLEIEAMRFYEDAIQSARDNDFVNVESIASERAGRFYRARGFETISRAYLREAYSGYARWGATSKVKLLDQEFPELMERMQNASITTVALQSEQLDAMAAVKVSQAISGQIVFSKLLETLMQTVIEQAGAQRGALLLLREDRLWIEAEAGASEARDAAAQLADTSERVPQSLLSYVRRTGEKVILADAREQNLFSSDAYIQRVRPKSVLCVPLLRQGQLMGMVYLENNLASNTFTTDRTTMLEMLASQAAISIENATLYEGLEQRVQERTRQLRETQAALVASARQAGMAEIATNVLHNVGNVLNSVNVSANFVSQKIRQSKSAGLSKAVLLMKEHAEDIGDFLTNDARGKQLPGYLDKLAATLSAEQQCLIEELERLTGSIDHIKEIVATQQSYAGASCVVEPLQVGQLIEDALQMNTEALTRHHVSVVKKLADIPLLSLDKHRVLLILVNLIGNAKQAMNRITDRPHQIILKTEWSEEAQWVRIHVADNGEGIAAENLARIFAHGFTTKKDGHGFGLHSCVLAAQEMGGNLRVHSAGIDQGAEFILELPLHPGGEDT